MRISRVFVDTILEPGTELTLDGQPAHYLTKVLRLNLDSLVVLFNGNGNDYASKIIKLNKKQVLLEITSVHPPKTESSLHISLGLGISRGERMDYAVQKSTELGVNEIAPLFTEHCEVKLQGERALKRRLHWQQIAINACQQSGRSRIPIIHPPSTLQDWSSKLTCSTRLMFDQHQTQALKQLTPVKKLAMLIGPEGGLSDDELKAARSLGFTGISLGPRILRTETAPVTALSILQFLWGDLS